MPANFVIVIDMKEKPLANLKMMTKILIGISLVINVMITPIAWFGSNNPESTVSSLGFLLLYFFKLPFIGMILAIVLSFGAMLGEPVFKMLTPQRDYLKRAKAHLILSEFFWGLMLGIVPNAVILLVFF